MTAISTVRLQREPFDAAAEAAKLTHGRTDIGAVVTFHRDMSAPERRKRADPPRSRSSIIRAWRRPRSSAM